VSESGVAFKRDSLDNTKLINWTEQKDKATANKSV